MDKDNLELIATLAIPTALFLLTSFRNVLFYWHISRAIDLSAYEDMNYTREFVRSEIKDMDQRGWFCNNVLNVGPRLAYERFLERNP